MSVAAQLNRYKLGEVTMRIIVRINDVRQYSPDDWESTVHVKEFPESATIRDFIIWQKLLYPKNKKIQAGQAIEQMHITMMSDL